ncbi:NADH-quinone oxidoreductase subunit L [soil metagenome]
MELADLSGDLSGLTLAVLLLPLLSFLVNIFVKKKVSGILGTSLISIAFFCALYLFFQVNQNGGFHFSFSWFFLPPDHSFSFGFLIDPIAALLLVIVTFISSLVHLYSNEYMKDDRGFSRYFAFLGLFTFSMLGIVVADNLLIIFIFWELVGFSSYLLIGFWFVKESAVKASKKAFIINRIGDAGFLIGILIIWSQLETLDLVNLKQVMLGSTIESGNWVSINVENGLEINRTIPAGWLTAAGILLFCGAIGKSAQFPLQVWLPDAMEGPTPVSALIHAATMVAAGVYLLARIFFVLNLEALTFIAFIGAITAFMGAFAALHQHDIKRVLAFSTISQLGFMIIGMGVGAYEAAVFHLATHAFFKACLFLCAGAVIFALHKIEHQVQKANPNYFFDIQDMRNMGGLRKSLPFTFAAYLCASMALAGLPLFSGLLSKDAILTSALSWSLYKNDLLFFIVPVLGFLAALLTAFYIGRQLFLVFFGDLRIKQFFTDISLTEIKEIPWAMRLPIIMLAILSLGFVFSINPFDASQSWLLKYLPITYAATPDTSPGDLQEGILRNALPLHYPVLIVSIFLALTGLGMAWIYYGPKSSLARSYFHQKSSQNWIGRLSFNNWFLDELYGKTVVAGTMKSAKYSAFFDKKFIDKPVEYIAIINVVLANLIAWLDRTFVDGVVYLGVYIVGKIGALTKSFQQGSIQSYLIYTLIGAILIIAWIII